MLAQTKRKLTRSTRRGWLIVGSIAGYLKAGQERDAEIAGAFQKEEGSFIMGDRCYTNRNRKLHFPTGSRDLWRRTIVSIRISITYIILIIYSHFSLLNHGFT